MLSIQEAGLEILGDNPKNLYFFCGEEYGIKIKYLEHLSNYYGNKIESESVESVLYSFKKKSLIAIPDSLYIVRYDLEFTKSLNDKVSKEIKSINIPGTLVVLFEDEKVFNKLDKYFPDNVIRFDKLQPAMISKYLIQDFPVIVSRFIILIVSYCDNYFHGYQICSQIVENMQSVSRLSNEEFLYSFGLTNNSSEDQFRIAVAAKNFSATISIIESFDGDLNYLLNCICNTMVEIDKLLDNKHAESPLKQYAKNWTRPDVYYMFNHTYNELNKLRSGGAEKVEDSLIYLMSLLRFKNIPSLEVVL